MLKKIVVLSTLAVFFSHSVLDAMKEGETAEPGECGKLAGKDLKLYQAVASYDLIRALYCLAEGADPTVPGAQGKTASDCFFAEDKNVIRREAWARIPHIRYSSILAQLNTLEKELRAFALQKTIRSYDPVGALKCLEEGADPTVPGANNKTALDLFGTEGAFRDRVMQQWKNPNTRYSYISFLCST